MSNWKSTGARILFLAASIGGFEEFGRHMYHEDHIQAQIHEPQPDLRENMIDSREAERRMAGLGMLVGFGCLIGVGAVGRKNSPKLTLL